MSSSAIPFARPAVRAAPRLGPPPATPGRLTTIDATRGAAMFFVCLSHFADMVLMSPSTRLYAEQLVRIGMIASPLFIIVSGTILGFLSASRGQEFRAVRYRMIDRSLLLLTIAHTLIAVANMPRLLHPSDAWRMVFITDTIALCAIAGSALVRITPAKYRIAFGAALYSLSWALVILWHPLDLQTRYIKDFFVGPLTLDSWAYVVPVLPWFAVYFAASTIGEHLARSGQGAWAHGLAIRLVRFGTGGVVIGLSMKVTYLLLIKFHFMPSSTEADIVHVLTGPFGKMPPSPDYLAIFGGSGLAILGLLIRFAARPQLAALTNWLALVGRNSLFVFIVQFYVYYVLLHAIRRPPVILWPPLFAGSVVAIVALASWWDRIDGNRFLTVGLAPLMGHGAGRNCRASAAHDQASAISG
jgi:uncharacterized membrane protein